MGGVSLRVVCKNSTRSIHDVIIIIIHYCFVASADSGRKLTLLYVANDVIQNSKKKGPEYRNEFVKVLPKVFQGIAKLVENDLSCMQI